MGAAKFTEETGKRQIEDSIDAERLRNAEPPQHTVPRLVLEYCPTSLPEGRKMTCIVPLPVTTRLM